MISPDNGSEEIDQLRYLLIGQDLDRIAELEDRLGDPSRRSAEVARVLPDAIKGARAKTLRDALEPVFEKAFESSVRKHPKELAEAIFPVIGPAIRKSISASIAEFAETLNQIVEKSVSFRGIQWRIEALVTGKSFSEILLARSLLYSVAQVFLVHRKSGLLLQHVAAKDAVLKDADMISGMLTAIHDFLSDSFAEGGQDLETVDIGRFKLWMQYGSKALLVGAVSGTAPVELKDKFRNALDRIQHICYADLDRFKQDDLSVFEAARPELEACLLGQAGPNRKRKSWVLWALAGLVILLIVAFGWYRVREQNRWDRYFDSLRKQPGIVVTGVEKRGSEYVVSGLKDPLIPAGKPASHEHVRFEWQPYLSLNTPFAAEREFVVARAQLENHLIRFDVGSSKISGGVAKEIDEAAREIAGVLRLRPGSRVGVTGRADEVGSPDMNNKLSADRAAHVMESLVAQGVPADRLQGIVVGNTKPLRIGATEWDRAGNRSVAFHVIPAQ